MLLSGAEHHKDTQIIGTLAQLIHDISRLQCLSVHGLVDKLGVSTVSLKVGRWLPWLNQCTYPRLIQVFEETKQQRYLDTARHMETYFLNNLPADGIVPW